VSAVKDSGVLHGGCTGRNTATGYESPSGKWSLLCDEPEAGWLGLLVTLSMNTSCSFHRKPAISACIPCSYLFPLEPLWSKQSSWETSEIQLYLMGRVIGLQKIISCEIQTLLDSSLLRLCFFTSNSGSNKLPGTEWWSCVFYLKWLLYTNIALVFEKCSGTSLPSAGVWNQPKIQISCSVCHKAPAKASTVDFRVLYSMWAGSNVLSFILYCERNSDAVQCYGLKSRFKMLPYWPFYYFLAVISLSFYIEAILSNCCCIPKYVFYKCWQ